ncbi:MAG TPA: DUF1330 domain-containing protein [Candidatus Thioglobus sp.]|nr:DUF1330 domain-containing protein [Candidatus Thioglobus sp.]
MAKGYVIGHMLVHDNEGYEKFIQLAGPVISEYGGKVLVRNPNPEIKEGKDSGIAIVLEFENIDNARKFYESEKYTKAREIRMLSAETDLIIVEGI